MGIKEKHLTVDEKAAFCKAFPRVFAASGLTTRGLADMVGVSFAAVVSWRKGRAYPSRENALRLESILGLHGRLFHVETVRPSRAPRTRKPVKRADTPAMEQTVMQEHSTGFWWIDKWLVTGEV